jgi:hypothetical protein
MAYSDYPDYVSAFNKASELGLKLYGAKDRRDIGLAAQMDRLAEKFGEDSPEYKKAKASFDKLQKEYNEADVKWKSVKAKIDAKDKSAKDAKDLDKKKKKDDSTLKQLEYERDSLRRQNKTAEAATKQKEIDDIKNSQSGKTGGTGTTLPLTDEQIVANEFTKAGVSADGTVQYGFPNPNGEGTSAGAAYIFVEPGKKGSTAYNGSGLYTSQDQDKSFAFGTTDEVLNKYYAQLVKQYGSKTALAQKLQEAGKLSNAKTADRAKILGALDKVVATYTADNTIAIKNGEIKELPTMDEYLTGMRGKGGGNSFTTSRTEISSETEAVRYLNQVSQSLTGKNYPQAKLAEGIKILQQMQKKNPSMTTTSRNDEGDTTSSVTRNGLDTQGFLISQIAQTDAAKEKQVLDYYQVFKNSFGVR